MLRRAGPLVAWMAMLVALVATMSLAGHGPLAAPPWADPAGWSAWAARRGAPAASLAVVRVVVLLVAAWLLAVTVASLALAASRRGREIDIAELLGVPIVRRVVQGALGLGLAGAAAAGGAGIGGDGGQRPAQVAAPAPAIDIRAPERPGPGPSGAAPSSGVGAGTGTAATTSIPLSTTTTTPLATTTTITPPPATTPVTTGPTPAAGTAAGAPGTSSAGVATAPSPSPDAETWVVRPGDHLWAIARQVLERGAYGPLDDARVATYWRVLLAANRDRLPVPANPDLLFAGDRLVVPPVPFGR